MKSDFLAVIGRRNEKGIMQDLNNMCYTVDDDHITPFQAFNI